MNRTWTRSGFGLSRAGLRAGIRFRPDDSHDLKPASFGRTPEGVSRGKAGGCSPGSAILRGAMSEENVAVVREVCAAWERGDWAASVGRYDPDLKVVFSTPLGEAGLAE